MASLQHLLMLERCEVPPFLPLLLQAERRGGGGAPAISPAVSSSEGSAISGRERICRWVREHRMCAHRHVIWKSDLQVIMRRDLPLLRELEHTERWR